MFGGGLNQAVEGIKLGVSLLTEKYSLHVSYCKASQIVVQGPKVFLNLPCTKDLRLKM